MPTSQRSTLDTQPQAPPPPHPPTHTQPGNRQGPHDKLKFPPASPPTPHQDTTPNNATRNPPATPCAPAMQT